MQKNKSLLESVLKQLQAGVEVVVLCASSKPLSIGEAGEIAVRMFREQTTRAMLSLKQTTTLLFDSPLTPSEQFEVRLKIAELQNQWEGIQDLDREMRRLLEACPE